MSIEEIKAIIEETGSYTGAIPSAPAMYYHNFSQRKGVWFKKEKKVRHTARMRGIVTGPGVYELDVPYNNASQFAFRLRQDGHRIEVKRTETGCLFTWHSRDDEFKEIFSKLNLQECLAVKAILDSYVERLNKEGHE